MQRKITSWIKAIAIIAGFTLCILIALFFLRNNYFKYSESFGFVNETNEINFINDTSIISKKICITSGCNETATILLKNINFNIDPCNNFFQFACGNFISNTRIPTDKSNIQTITIITDKVEAQVIEIISEPIQPDDIEPFVLAKQLYKACMNEKMIEQRGLQPLTNILNKLEGWPVLEKNKWNETSFQWNKTLIEVNKIGLIPDVIISLYIDIDAKNNTKHVLTIDEAYLGLDREYFIEGLENEVVQAYFEYMVNVAVAMGANEIDATKELKESLVFEMKLANLTLSMKERENVSSLYNLKSIDQMQKTYPTIPWLNYINNMLYSLINITKDEIVINAAPNYIKAIEKLLNETPKRTVANYIIWRTVKQTIALLPEHYRKFSYEFRSIITGVTAQSKREKQCFNNVDENMYLAVGALYARKVFKKDSKRQTVELLKNIQLEFKDILENLEWMDNKTKQHALEKIVAVYAHIAYPEELMDDNKIIDYYENLKFNENKYVESMLNLFIFLNTKEIKQLREPFNKTQWTRHSDTTDVNAFYSPMENSIDLSAGILQGEFFSSDRPKYLNYGGIGFVIGHELTHGFDDFGREFDKDGNLVDWWEPTTNDAFVNKAKCIINQYGNYTVGNLSLNGKNTHNENIADNGGIKCAYCAYKRWTKTHDTEPSLPGLSFTPRQMFWISMASTWCSKYRPEYLRDLVMTDVHSPAEFRVNGVVSNQEEFAKDFGCSKESPMNPAMKCNVW